MTSPHSPQRVLDRSSRRARFILRALVVMVACIAVASCGALSSTAPTPRTSPDSAPTPPPSANGKSIVVGVSVIHFRQWEDAEDVTAFIQQQGIELVLTIASKHFRENDAPSFDRLRERIEKRIPANFTGYACFDCEKYFEHYKKMNGPDFEAAIHETIRIVEFAKALRPNAKWGFYGLPLRSYWDRDDQWKQINDNLMSRLIDHVDVLYPSIYDFYPDDRGGKKKNGAAKDHAYVKAVVGEAIALSKGKPVLPFVSMRYHIGTKNVSLHRIPDEEMAAHMRAAMEVEHDGQRIAGFVKWATDHYHAKLGKLPDAAPKGSDEYLNELMLHHLCLMEQVANNVHCDF